MSLKWMEKKGKRILGAALRAVLPSRSVNPTDQDWNRIERVLLVRQDRRIGDLVMNTPLFHATRRRFPSAHIALLLRREYEGLYEADPHLDELIPFSSGRDFYNPIGFAALASRLRRGRFDLAIDCSNFMSFSLTNGVVTLLSGAPVRIGFDDKESPAFLNVTVKQGVLRHYVENQLELLAPMGGAQAEEGPWLHISAERLDRARRVIMALGVAQSAPKALLFTGAGNKSKTWSAERFLEVAHRLSEAGVSVVLAHAPGGGTGRDDIRKDAQIPTRGTVQASRGETARAPGDTTWRDDTRKGAQIPSRGTVQASRGGTARAPGGGARSRAHPAAGAGPQVGAGELPCLPDMAIADFAAAISCFDVFVSGDTGPMHVAVACGVATVGIFLEDNIARYGYRDGRSHIAVRVREAALHRALRVTRLSGASEVAAAALEALGAKRL